MNILLTGSAGFIGFHATTALLARGHRVTGIDELNAYYDPALKRARLAQLEGRNGFRFVKADISTDNTLDDAANGEHYDVILHLAAQAGVRYALKEPKTYTRSNLVGHHNVLEFARHHEGLQHFVYASSSSVYGNDSVAPFSENERADHPVSYYGATKRAGELLSYSYAELFGLKQTALRFFTVYGDWGRPDMAYWLFTDAIFRGQSLPVFGQGKLRRDFTHIDDIVAALVRIVETPFIEIPGQAPHRVFNLGNSHPETVLDLIRHIEAATGRKAVIEWTDGPQGDVRETYADISRAKQAFGFAPRIPLADGIERFVHWYRQYTGL
ncbi:MAG: NAD-dependent epimerase/dehydratase family protein [Alphaproteobacteria bacterium]|nr:NAD-dependent epimerase/dehydratase family protein [Alphaproteobacteria bacterium]MDE2492817.1 NAD-dependent epimerase/dehydratase family protein [Alphaproteobacteria bacterium]